MSMDRSRMEYHWQSQQGSRKPRAGLGNPVLARLADWALASAASQSDNKVRVVDHRSRLSSIHLAAWGSSHGGTFQRDFEGFYSGAGIQQRLNVCGPLVLQCTRKANFATVLPDVMQVQRVANAGSSGKRHLLSSAPLHMAELERMEDSGSDDDKVPELMEVDETDQTDGKPQWQFSGHRLGSFAEAVPAGVVGGLQCGECGECYNAQDFWTTCTPWPSAYDICCQYDAATLVRKFKGNLGRADGEVVEQSWDYYFAGIMDETLKRTRVTGEPTAKIVVKTPVTRSKACEVQLGAEYSNTTLLNL
ncbi:hypothetical protein B0H17DRAFT_1149972 [Mycena rosella]|uniref:Uncharacterized protein n=1 Tax=Mycena rosella TaxID=1033263 RepID=A0AAD7BVU0_MYCRO|nr:hypothetical protein B0H17DRAFT_1149972 [Mycena rosella]